MLNEDLKMKPLYLILFVILISCKSSSENFFTLKEVACNPEQTPQFDYNKVQLIDSETGERRDTMVGEIPKSRTVFKPCRRLIYRAIYSSSNGEIISDNLIKMMATGKRWEFQPEIQDEILIQYQFDHTDFIKNREQQLNKGLSNDNWIGEVIEGIIENDEEIWMHPFRVNQYNFTEVAPFPKIQYPNQIKIGNSWTGNLSVGQGWGDWENTSGSSFYEVTSKESITTEFGEIRDCWKIESISTWDFGKSTLDFWFHNDLGFVKMNYVNYGNQTLLIELKEVFDK